MKKKKIKKDNKAHYKNFYISISYTSKTGYTKKIKKDDEKKN